ncbi:MAG: stage II sporulation protein M [Actinomycetes bacterium]
MDLDRYIQRNDGTWRRLDELSRRAARSPRALAGTEVAELVSLYQKVSAQLSHARTTYADPDLNARLSRLLGAARVVIYRRRSNALRTVARFTTSTFPAAVWNSRRYVLVSALLFLVPALGVGLWLANSPTALDAAVPRETRELIAQKEFRDYYRSDAAQNFAGRVTFNNIIVSFLAFATGVVPLVGTGTVMVLNGLNVGAVGAVMHQAGQGPQFWGLILPHGLLEITAVVVAGAAGLRLGWAIVAPGDRTRRDALAQEGLRAVVLVGGLVAAFVVAGFVEGFITPSALPTALRVGVGVAVWSAFVTYVVVLGSRAERAGLTGLLSETERDPLEVAEAAAERGTLLRIR